MRRVRTAGGAAVLAMLAIAIGGCGGGGHLRIDRAGTDLRHGHSLPWKRLIAEAKLGHGHVEHYSAMDEEVVSCNDYPLPVGEGRFRVAAPRRPRASRSQLPQPGARPVLADGHGLSSGTLYQYCLTAPRPSSLYEPPVSPGQQPTKAPVLVISGELDNVTTPYEGKLVAKEFPDSRQYVARGAGHVADLYTPRHPKAGKKARHFLHHVYDRSG